MADFDTIIVGAGGGLADRTRVLFSYVQAARLQQKKLVMLWELNNHLPSRYDEAFEPVLDVEFRYGKHFREQYKDIAEHWGPSCHPQYDPLCCLMREMIPLPAVCQAIRTMRGKLQPGFVALHVRRFDLERCADPLDFAPYDAFLREHLQPDEQIFLATDAQPTQTRFQETYGDRIVTFDAIPWLGYCDRNNVIWQRQTNLVHTVVDLFVCCLARKFLGTFRDPVTSFRRRKSGFTSLIESLRQQYSRSGLPSWL